MTKKSKSPLTYIQILKKVIFWTQGAIGVGLLCLIVFIVWFFYYQPDNNLLRLQNYEEFYAILKNENIRTDGKTLPLYESLSTSNYWSTDYDGNIPPELLNENTLVVTAIDGFQDTAYIGLFNLSEKSAEALFEQLNKRFSKDGEGVDINRHTENGLCLNHVLMNSWSINSKKKNDFFQFCTQTRHTEKIEWDLIMPNGNGFEYIYITQYVGTTFFTVRHGGS